MSGVAAERKHDPLDWLEEQNRIRARQSIVTSRLAEMFEATEKDCAVYTENPPKMVITLDASESVTATGPIARKAYEMVQRKKNLPPAEEVLAFMRQFTGMDEKPPFSMTPWGAKDQ